MAELHNLSLATDLVPDDLEYAVLEAPANGDSPRPLLYLLHGGNGSRDFLEQMRPLVEAAWNRGELPPAVVVTPSAKRSFYMDTKDGSEKWETAILGPLTDAVVDRFGPARARASTAVIGVSMGGMGALRMAFKHPDRFCAVAALEPGIEPVLDFGDIDIEDRFWRDDALFQSIFGSPVDEAYWRANHPAAIAHDAPASWVEHAPAILVECGDQDSFGLHRGAEFLHRVLFDRGVPHDYHLVRGADHLGQSMVVRFADAFRFLGSMLAPEPDLSLGGFHKLINTMRERAGLAPLDR